MRLNRKVTFSCLLACLISICFTSVLRSQDTTLRVKANTRTQPSKKSKDSLVRVRARRRRAQDSLLRTLRRDSLRAGYAVRFKGKRYRINTPAGRRLHDSLSNPLRFRKFAFQRDSGTRDSAHRIIPAIPAMPAAVERDTAKLASRARAVATIMVQLQKERATKKADSLRLAIARRLPYIPYYTENYNLRSKAVIARVETEAWIDRHYNQEQAKRTLLTFPPPGKHVEPPIKGRPYVQPGAIHTTRPLWFITIILIVLALIAIVKARYPRDLQEIFESLFSDRIIRSNREAGILYSPSFIFIFFGFCLVAGLLIYDYIEFKKLDLLYSDFSLYMIISASVFGFFMIKLLIYRTSAALFDIDRLIKPHLTFYYVTIANFTIAGLTFLIFYSFYNAAFLPKLVVWIPLIFVVFLIFLYLRSLIYSIRNFEFQKFYLFLYFCTFEICPLIIVFKLING